MTTFIPKIETVVVEPTPAETEFVRRLLRTGGTISTIATIRAAHLAITPDDVPKLRHLKALVDTVREDWIEETEVKAVSLWYNGDRTRSAELITFANRLKAHLPAGN